MKTTKRRNYKLVRKETKGFICLQVETIGAYEVMESKLIELQERLIDKYLTPDNKSQRTGKITGYNCLFCDSGTGRNGTGITFTKSNNDNDKLIFTCFNCGSIKGDTIFDIVIKRENIQGNNKEQFAKLFEIAGIETDKKTYKKEVSEQTKEKIKQYQAKQEEEEKKQVEVYKQIFENATQNRNKAIEYLTSRAINKEYANNLQNIGFYNLTSEIAKQAKAPISFIDKDKSKNDLIIIKIKDNFYIQRFTNRATNSKFKTLNATGLHSQIYNEEVLLNTSGIVFVVEGIFDCLSIESIGYKAIALNSTSNADKLIEYIKANREKIKGLQVILLCDTDTAGTTANNLLLNELKALNIKAYIKTEILQKESVKDMNELLMKDTETAKKAIETAIEEVKAEEQQRKENFTIEYTKEEDTKKKEKETITIQSDREHIKGHLLRIEQPDREHIKTGFKQLDIAVNKGLTTGLYIIGAKAGTGKTAFILQVSDYIARTQNKKVLFFSLEQGKNALFNRRIARIVFENMKEKIQQRALKDFTTADFTNLADFKDIEFYGEQYEQNQKKNKNIYNAVETFYNYANNVFTIDNIYTVEDIKKVIMNCINQGEKPVVFIDYLQRLKPSNNNEDYNKFEDKRLFDTCIQQLKDLIKKENLIVFLISSLNRQGKETELNAYSGSNEIEFNAEFAGTLQIDKSYYDNIGSGNIREIIQNDFNKNQYKRLKLSILKQKDGISGIDIDLKLYAKSYYFEEVEDIKSEQTSNSDSVIPAKKKQF